MPVTADQIFDGDWDGIAPQQRGCFRALAVPSTKNQRTGGGIVSITVNPKTPSYGGGGGGGNRNQFQEEYNETPKRKLLSNPPRSKSVPPSSRGQRIKTVVVQEEESKNKTIKSTASTISADTDALLGRRKLKTNTKKSSDDYDDRIDSAYVPPQKDRFLWNQSLSPPTIPATQSSQTRDSDKTSSKERGSSFFDTRRDKGDEDIPIIEASNKGNTTQTSTWRSSGHQSTNQTRGIVKERSFVETKKERLDRDLSSESSATDWATSKNNPLVSNAISTWKMDCKDAHPESSPKTNSSFTKPVSYSKGSPSSFSQSPIHLYETQKKTAGDTQNRKRLDPQNDLNIADLLSTNLKQMERDIKDLNNRKYSKEAYIRKSTSKEDEYLLSKQKIQEQEDILLREQKLIPAVISLQSGVRNEYVHKSQGDEDSVSELGTESVTPKLNTSGLTLVYADRGKRANYVNDIDDTVEILDDTPYSSYHRGTSNHFKNRIPRRDVAQDNSEYGPYRRTKSKSLTRFDNRGLPDVSLIDSSSEDVSAREVLEDEINYPLHRKGLSLTEAFNDFGLDDRISTVRKSQLFEDETDVLNDYEYKVDNLKVGRRVQNEYSPSSQSTDTRKSNQSTAITRFLASRSLRSNKYVEAGGAVRLKRDHDPFPIEKRRPEEEKTGPISRSNSTKRGTLPKGSFPVVTTPDYESYEMSKEYFDMKNNSSFGTQRSRRMMRSL